MIGGEMQEEGDADMGRRRQKPCEYCDGEKFFQKDGSNGHALNVELYPENCLLAVVSFANGDTGEMIELKMDIPMYYCPCCGRKLGYE